MAEPAMASASTSSTAMMHDATTTSTAMMHDATSTSAIHEVTTSVAKAYEATTTSSAQMHDATSTAAAAATTTSAMYGSGSANWGTDLNSCVQSESLASRVSEIIFLTCSYPLSVPGQVWHGLGCSSPSPSCVDHRCCWNWCDPHRHCRSYQGCSPLRSFRGQRLRW